MVVVVVVVYLFSVLQIKESDFVGCVVDYLAAFFCILSLVMSRGNFIIVTSRRVRVCMTSIRVESA